jgi:lipoate-protein ligase A
VVAHGEDLTYTLIVPWTHEFARRSARDSNREIHARIAEALIGGGIDAHLTKVAAARMSAECFANPAESDLLTGDRKIAGAAQRRTRWGLLHQGSIQGCALAEDFASRLAENFAREIAGRPLSEKELEEAQALATEKYASAVWQLRF